MSELEGIAIIGLHGRFPGADSVEEFWQNLAAGRDTISFFNDDELVQAGLNVESLNELGNYVPARGVMRDAECFDRGFFGIHPKEAEVMDPQHRVFLEGCWEALERSGYAPGRIDVPVGIYCGATFNSYFMHALHNRPDLIELVGHDQVMFGNEKDYIATRTAYKLNLSGPAISLNTACSSSLTAICQACQSLLTYQCDMSIAGGVSVTVPQTRGYHFQEGNIGSPDGHTRTFDAHAQGTAFSNGLAVVVLKRVDEALADGDQIYGVIKGFAVNNDGADRVSFGAPGVDGQAEVIALAQAVAGVEPDDISYVEAHGTATPVGDPIEVAALTDAFRRETSRKQFCALGSVKSNVGHLDAASGAAGLIKTALALHHRQIPANPHFKRPNPKLDLENTPFYVNTELLPWDQAGDKQRYAGVSSFGTGGTNAHVIVEEAPLAEPSGPSRLQQLLLMSAKTPEALERMKLNLAKHLQSCPDANLADAAFTLHTGRSEFVHRHSVVCSSTQQACSLLESPTPYRVVSAKQDHKDPPVVFMFPGQGAQFAGMGADLYQQEPVFRDVVDRCAELLRPILKEDLRDVLFPTADKKSEATEKIRQTKFTQPAIFVIEYALAKLWMSWGITPSAMIGHSVGEFVAACLAGVLKLDDALSLIACRAELVQSMPPGSMLAVRMPEAEILPLLTPHLVIAAVNSPALCVVAGPHESVDELEKQLSDRGVFAKRLRTSHAFHSQMMDPVIEPFTEVLRGVEFSEPEIPYVSNVTAEWVSPADATSPEYWAGHVRQAVRFSDGVEKLLQDPSYVLLEVGPGRALTQLAMQHPSRDKSQRIVTSMPYSEEDDPPGILAALGSLWTAGVNVDWQVFYAHEKRRRVVLPTYPFEKTICWPSTPVAGTSVASTPANSAPATGTPVPASNTQNQFVGHVDASEIAAAPVQPLEPLVPVTEAEVSVVPDIPRKERLVAEICAVLEELSGSSISPSDASVNLLEFGFDSLLLTQVATLLRKRFKTKITFRQLMEELSTIDAIASYVDTKLPAEPERKPATPVVAPSPSASSAPNPAIAAGPHVAPLGNGQVVGWQGLEPMLEQHLAAATNLLHQMRQRPATNVTAQPTSALKSGIAIDSDRASALTAAEPRASHGPFKSLDSSNNVELTKSQRSQLDAFIARYTKRTATSKKLAAENRSILADPRSVAGFKSVWKEAVYPLHTVRSDGSKIWDVDGNEYVDFVMGFGASLFGHRPPFVVEAVKAQLDAGFETGPISPMAGEVARLVRELTGAERVAFCSTGSEGVLAAIRVARTVTARDKIVIFEGAYHGIFDEVLARPLIRNGELRSMPTAPGIPDGTFGEIIVLQYGNPTSLEIIEQYGDDIAAVLVEPVQARRLDLVPREFLHQLRQITHATGTALVFDEVVTGFRVQPGGAQAYFGIKADLATYGKVVGGGLPIGIVTGKPMYMDALDGGPWQFGDDSAPEVGVTFFAGTFVRHPLALAAAKSVLTHLKQEGPDLQVKVAEKADRVATAFRELFDRFNAPYHLCHFSSLVYVSVPPEFTYGALLFCHLRERGIHIFENRLFVLTTTHTEEDLQKLLHATKDSLVEMQRGGFLLHDGRSASALTTTMPVARTEIRPYPSSKVVETNELALTQAQQEIWLTAKLGKEAFRAYNTSFVVRIQGNLNRRALEFSLQALVGRHDSLRAAFDLTNPVQRYQPEVKLDIPFVDLSGISNPEREQRFDKLAREQADQDFDIDSPPLFRAQIVCIDSDQHRLVLSASHLVADGWSVGVLLHDLKLLYRANSKNVDSPLQQAMQFTEYLQLLNSLEHLAEVKKAEQYWQKEFLTLPTPLELPTDRQRLPHKTYDATRQSVVWDEEFTRLIRKACAEQRTTVLNFLLAGFTALLQRLSGQEDLVVGIPAAGQISPTLESSEGSQSLVGHCVNLLPVRSHCSRDQTFQSYLKALKSKILNAYDHQSLTFSRLLELLKVPRESNRLPLVTVMFNVDRTVSGFELDGLDTTVEELSRSSIVFDIFCNIVDDDKHLRVDFEFNSDLFDATTIKRWIEYFRELLVQAATNIEVEINQIELLSDEERQQTLIQWNQTQRDYPSSDCLHRLFEQQAHRTPNKTAVRFADQAISYADLDRRANQLAQYLKSRGVQSEVLVAICLERAIDMVVGLLGILKAGGAYVPIDPAFPKDRIAFMLEDSKAQLLVTQNELSDILTIDGLDVVCLDGDASAWQSYNGDTPPHDDVNSENLAYVIFTSGSTGRPKGVQISHQAMVNFLNSMRHTPGMSSDDILLAVTTLSFDMAVLEIYLPIICGGIVEIVSGEAASDAMMLIDSLENSQATIMQATPATWRMLIEAGWRGAPNLSVLCGGEAMPRDLIDPLLRRCAELWNMYGPTETTVWSSVERITSSDGSISIGRPIDNTQMYVLNEQLQPVPSGVTGELYIGGDGLARGYLNRSELTNERFIRDPFSPNDQARIYNTGDLSRHLSDGRLQCLGRKDGQVKIRGYRIELGEIEAVLSTHPQVQESVVIQREFAPGDVRLLAYVVYVPGVAEMPLELHTLLREKLPNYMVPSSVIALDALPRTPNGKIDRKPLVNLEVGVSRVEVSFQPPTDQIELHLSQLWEHLLNVRPVGVHDDFFELGGHSLLGVQLMVQIEKTYGKRLPLATLLQARTIAGLADIIRSEQWQPKWRSLVPIREAGSKTPLFLFHAHGGNVLEYHTLVGHLPADRPVYALQARGLDGNIPEKNDITDMARRYIQEIRDLQPEGPYYLVGYCFGGYLALEAACQLEAAGEDVVFVGLIQSMAPDFSRHMHGGNLFAKSFRRSRRRVEIEFSELQRIGAKSLLAKLIQLKEKIQGLWGIWLDSVRRRPSPSDRKSSLPRILELLEREHEKAFEQHTPSSCLCPVTLFPAEKQLRREDIDPAFGWRTLLNGKIEIHQVPGHQQTMLKTPNVEVLADKLNLRILAAEQLSERSENSESDNYFLAEKVH